MCGPKSFPAPLREEQSHRVAGTHWVPGEAICGQSLLLLRPLCSHLSGLFISVIRSSGRKTLSLQPPGMLGEENPVAFHYLYQEDRSPGLSKTNSLGRHPHLNSELQCLPSDVPFQSSMLLPLPPEAATEMSALLSLSLFFLKGCRSNIWKFPG